MEDGGRRQASEREWRRTAIKISREKKAVERVVEKGINTVCTATDTSYLGTIQEYDTRGEVRIAGL